MALLFNGTTDYLSQAAALFGTSGTCPCSMAVWYKPANSSGTQCLLSSSNTSVNATYLNVRVATGIANSLYAQSGNGSPARGVSSTSLITGQWNHLVAVFSSTSITDIYLNGVKGTHSGGNNPLTGLSETIIGALYNFSTVNQFANGSIAYPAGWKGYGLTQSDVDFLYNAGSGADPNSLSIPPNATFSTLQTATNPSDSVSGSNWTVHGSPSVVADPFIVAGSIPIVANRPPVSLLGGTSATLNGLIANSPGSSVTVEGFNYGPTQSLGTDVHTNNSIAGGPFQITVSGLTGNTVYYYKAYGTNSTGTGNAPDVFSFTTLASGNTTGTVLYDGNTAIGISKFSVDTSALWDSSSATAWRTSQTSGDWVGLDVGASILLQYIKISALIVNEDTLIGGKFQGTNDSTWSTGIIDLYTITTRPLSGTLVNTYTVNSSTPLRYYRYLIPSGSVPTGLQGNLGDLQLYGTYSSGASGTACSAECFPNGGHFSLPTRIRFSCQTTSCSIYYTLDGSTPTINSSLYSGPFVISSSCVVNSIASGPNVEDSHVASFPFYVKGEWVTTDKIVDVAKNRTLQLVGSYFFYDPVSGYWCLTGQDRVNPVHNSYRSADFFNWEFTGPETGIGPAPGALTGLYNTLQYSPFVLYNSLNNNYCAIAKKPGISLPFYSSNNPNGPWTLVNTYTNVNGLNVYTPDTRLFLDTDGKAYLITGTGNNQGFMSAQLGDDFLSFSNIFSTISSWGDEGWTMCVSNGNYFMIFSGQTNWTPNMNQYIVRNSPLISSNSGMVNPFQSYGGTIPNYVPSGITPSSSNSFDTQSQQIIFIPGRNAYIYNGSRYDVIGNDFSHALPILLPIAFPSSTTMTISWHDSWNLDSVFPTVSGAPISPTNLMVTNGVATWTNNEPKAVNLYLDTADDSDFKNNIASEVISPMDGITTQPESSFAITVSGNYYRVRAVNANGSTSSATVQEVQSVTVPNVLGLSQLVASGYINSIGLIVGSLSYQQSSAVSFGNVISQSIDGGSIVSPGTSINLVISSGAHSVTSHTVPNVVSKDLVSAIRSFRFNGYILGNITYINNSIVPVGKIISQNPTAGSLAPSGINIDVVISLGPNPIAKFTGESYTLLNQSDDDVKIKMSGHGKSSIINGPIILSELLDNNNI